MSAPSAVSGEAFRLEYSSVGGRELGPGVHQRESHLRLNSADRWVFLEKHRSESDGPGEPIGTFAGQLPAEAFNRLWDLAHRVRLAELPGPAGADFSTTLITIKLERGSTSLTKTLTSGDMPRVLQVQDLLVELNRISAAVQKSAVAAVQVSVAVARREGGFTLTLANIGTQGVCFSDPRLLRQDDPYRWAGVRVAEFPPERPGVTSPPLKWTQLLLAPAPQPVAVARVLLKPGERFAAPTAAWKAPRSGVRYLVQAVWSDYTGPREAEGCYQIRGAVFSEGLEVTPK